MSSPLLSNRSALLLPHFWDGMKDDIPVFFLPLFFRLRKLSAEVLLGFMARLLTIKGQGSRLAVNMRSLIRQAPFSRAKRSKAESRRLAQPMRRYAFSTNKAARMATGCLQASGT